MVLLWAKRKGKCRELVFKELFVLGIALGAQYLLYQVEYFPMLRVLVINGVCSKGTRKMVLNQLLIRYRK